MTPDGAAPGRPSSRAIRRLHPARRLHISIYDGVGDGQWQVRTTGDIERIARKLSMVAAEHGGSLLQHFFLDVRFVQDQQISYPRLIAGISAQVTNRRNLRFLGPRGQILLDIRGPELARGHPEVADSLHSRNQAPFHTVLDLLQTCLIPYGSQDSRRDTAHLDPPIADRYPQVANCRVDASHRRRPGTVHPSVRGYRAGHRQRGGKQLGAVRGDACVRILDEFAGKVERSVGIAVREGFKCRSAVLSIARPCLSGQLHDGRLIGLQKLRLRCAGLRRERSGQQRRSTDMGPIGHHRHRRKGECMYHLHRRPSFLPLVSVYFPPASCSPKLRWS